jgi:hypothetical protein
MMVSKLLMRGAADSRRKQSRPPAEISRKETTQVIVVNLKRSMDRLLSNVQLGIPDDVLLQQIKHDTLGDWGGISVDALEEYGQYVLGVHGDRIASAYRIVGLAAPEHPGRKRFDAVDAVELADVIGRPVPGGAWRRGQARPVRYLDTEVFMRHFDSSADDASKYDDDEVARRMVAYVREQAVSSTATASKSASAVEDLLSEVTVEAEPRGGIRVTVPMGTKVTIVQRAD